MIWLPLTKKHCHRETLSHWRMNETTVSELCDTFRFCWAPQIPNFDLGRSVWVKCWISHALDTKHWSWSDPDPGAGLGDVVRTGPWAEIPGWDTQQLPWDWILHPEPPGSSRDPRSPWQAISNQTMLRDNSNTRRPQRTEQSTQARKILNGQMGFRWSVTQTNA